MELISLRNFKSYENQLITNLNPRINVILGSNGQGKSNLFKAIAFTLTDRTPLNPTQHNTHLHKALDPTSRPLAVQIYLRPKHTQDFIKLERTWPDQNTEELRVEGKLVSKGDFEAVVESFGLSYSNPYNILQQGKVNQVTLMDDFDLYKLLEEATGVRKYEQRHAEALTHVRKNQEQKEEVKALLHELQSRLELYQSRKEQQEFYSFQEKATKVKSQDHYQRLLRKFTNDIVVLTEKQAQSAQNLNKTKNNIKDIKSQLQQIVIAIDVNHKRLFEYSDISTQDESLTSTDDMTALEAKLKQIEAQKRAAVKKLQKAAKQTQRIKKEMQPFKQRHETLTGLLAAERLAKDGKDGGKEQLKQWIKRARANLKEVQTELSKVTKVKSEFKGKSKSQDGQQEQELKNQKQKFALVNNELKTCKLKCLEAARTRNQHESEVEVFGKQVQHSYSQMRKVLPLLEFNLLNQVKARKIPGVYGFLIEYLDILPTVLFAYESAGMGKLCTLLVQNQATVSAVVALNRELKGRQIQILPLSFVSRSPAIKKNIPSVDDCFSLLNEDWVKIRPHPHGDDFTKNIRKIVINTFGGHVLVKDYELGLKISKEYHLNCITADKEIIYSQGFLCKVGKDNSVDDRLELYYKYADKSNQLQESNLKLAQSSKILTIFQNQQMQLHKKRVIIESQLNNLQLNIDFLTEQKKSLGRLQEQQSKLIQKKQKLQSDISSKEELLNNIGKKTKTKLNPEECKEIKQKYENILQIYNKESSKEYQIENQLSAICKEEEQIKQKIKNASFQVSFRKDLDFDFMGEKQFQGSLEREKERLEIQKKRIELELGEIEEKLENEQKEDYNLVGNISLLEEQVQFCKDQLQEIGTLDITLEEIQQKSNSFSVSMTRIDERKKVRIITAAERLIFSKLQGFYHRYQEALTKMKELEQAQTQINAMIDHFQTEKDRSVTNVFSSFEKHFQRIFKAVTLSGKTDVRLKKSNERNRGFLKVRNSLSVLVSFDERETTHKWSQFSGGQKTVVAVCLLMALQKCQPAPFYVLDEADAALDPVYLQRIADLIMKESENTQYLISSFKRAMTRFPNEICNYYLVESRDRVSSVRRVDSEQAERVAQQLAEG